MKYADFERVIGSARMSRYRAAMAGDTKKAMTLYRKNLKVSQEMFTIISCLEIAMRNTIDQHYTRVHGRDWLRNGSRPGGIFDTHNCRTTQNTINDALRKLGTNYTHNKLVAELGFGFWRYLFANHQFAAGGRNLLAVFPAKPRSTPAIQYNQGFVFNQLAAINDIRNRIAHHEPICFASGFAVRNTADIRTQHAAILSLLQWMDIDQNALLYGMDHVTIICDQIDHL